MQIGKVINLRNFNLFFKVLSKNKTIIILLSIFLVGFISGIFSLDNYPNFKKLFSQYLNDFLSVRTNSGFLKIACNSFGIFITYIVLAFVSGTSLIGIVFIPFIIGIIGFLNGGFMALLYSEYALKGIAFNAVMVLPCAVIFTISIILATRESIGFSLRISRLTFPSTAPTNLFIDFKNYCGRFLLITVFVLFSAVIDGLISHYFLNKFVI